MLDLYRNIRKLRISLGLTQTDLAKLTGYGDRSSIAKIEKGMIDLPQSKIELFATALHTTPGDLVGVQGTTDDIRSKYSNIHDVDMQRIPMLGSIACGLPIYMNEAHETYVESGNPIDCDFCLRCKGDSMVDAGILDGYIVFIKRDVDVINGKVYAVSIDDEATLKRVYYDESSQILQLVAANPAYAPIVISQSDAKRVTILGRAVMFQGEIL